jgi:DNA-binding CsgD family transcriptional regulator
MEKKKLLSGISKREKEVVWLLAQGLTATQIGKKLSIAPTTVITHRNRLRAKLKCKNCAHLVYTATRIGLLKNPHL